MYYPVFTLLSGIYYWYILPGTDASNASSVAILLQVW